MTPGSKVSWENYWRSLPHQTWHEIYINEVVIILIGIGKVIYNELI